MRIHRILQGEHVGRCIKGRGHLGNPGLHLFHAVVSFGNSAGGEPLPIRPSPDLRFLGWNAWATYSFFVGMQPFHNNGSGNVRFPPPFPFRLQPVFHEEDVIDGSATPALADACNKENPHAPGIWLSPSSHMSNGVELSVPERINTAYVDGHVGRKKFGRRDAHPDVGVGDPNHFVPVYYSEFYFKGG